MQIKTYLHLQVEQLNAMSFILPKSLAKKPHRTYAAGMGERIKRFIRGRSANVQIQLHSPWPPIFRKLVRTQLLLKILPFSQMLLTLASSSKRCWGRGQHRCV